MGRNRNKTINKSRNGNKNSRIESNGLKKDLKPPSFSKLGGKFKINSINFNNDLIQQKSKDFESNNDLIKESFASSSSSSTSELALNGKKDNSAKAFMKDVKNVIENSDIIIEVLDARDPLGSRSKQVEENVLLHGKKLILLINKIDLIPIKNLESWLNHFRKEFPTLAFKSTTQQQRNNLSQNNGKISNFKILEKLNHGSEAIGSNILLQLLKNYSRTAIKSSKIKQQLTVGLIGPPNVGKSSVINSLLRSRACAVASTPGWTKNVQGVMLEKSIRLLDCPGVVMVGKNDNDNQEDLSWKILRNTIKVELIQDPIAPIQSILSRVDSNQLIKLYSIEGGFNEGDVHDFLLRIALLRGKLGKGGIPDLEGAARIVLHDWNIGKIAFHSNPPIDENISIDKSKSEGAILNEFSQAFDFASLLGEADAEIFGNKSIGGSGVLEKQKELLPIPTPIIEDKDEELNVAITNDVPKKTPKKRMIGMDSSDEDNDDGNSDDDGDDDEEENFYDNNNIETNQKDFTTINSTIPIQNSNRKELQQFFSQAEIEHLAPKRKDIRKNLKRQKKKLKKSGADLVDALESSLALKDSNLV